MEVCFIDKNRYDDLMVFSVCTDQHSNGLHNLTLTLEMFDYKYKILGKGEVWGGWKWRTQKYIDAIEKLPKEQLICLVDANDLLFLQSSKTLVQNFKSYNRDIVIGAESGCCTGPNKTRLFKRQTTINRYLEELKDKHFIFPNGGFLMGYRTPLLYLLNVNANEIDDQAGYFNKWIDYKGLFGLDTETKCVGNITQTTNFFDKMVEMDESSNWSILTDKTTRRIYVKCNLTGNIPCVLHFPGSNFEGYNIIVEKLLGEKHIPIKVSFPNNIKVAIRKPWTVSLLYLIGK